MTPYYDDGRGIRIFCGDALEVMREIEAGSVSLVASDPPYFRVVEEAFDQQWSSPAAFLEWLAGVADEWRRVLAPPGSLYCFASPAMAARVEVMLSERFDVLNSLVWVKSHGRAGKAEKEALRAFFPDSERILFAEHIGAEGSPAQRTGYASADAIARSEVFEPLRRYLVEERDRAGVSNRQVDEHLGTAGMASHYFGASQWALPTAPVYDRLRVLFAAHGGGRFLERSHFELFEEYSRLRVEHARDRVAYDALRRPFATTNALPFRDVWTHAQAPREPGRHVCEKPLAMMRNICEISTRPGDLVLDSFMGSGTTLRACKDLGLPAIGIEVEERWCEVAANRLRQEVLL